MRYFLLSAALLMFSALPALADPQPSTQDSSSCSAKLFVHVDNIANHKGKIGVALFTSKKGFPDNPEKAFRTQNCDATVDHPCFVFEDIPCGVYAVSVLHDENGDGKMEKSFPFGIPEEGFGVSNNPKIGFGPPSFKEAYFSLDGTPRELTVNMIYLGREIAKMKSEQE